MTKHLSPRGLVVCALNKVFLLPVFSALAITLVSAAVGCMPATPAPARLRIKDEQSFLVHVVSAKRESPSQIAKWYVGSPKKWKEIVEANKALEGKRALDEGEIVLIPLAIATKKEHMPVAPPPKTPPKKPKPAPLPARPSAEGADGAAIDASNIDADPLESNPMDVEVFQEVDPFMEGEGEPLPQPSDQHTAPVSAVEAPVEAEVLRVNPTPNPLPVPQHEPSDLRQKSIEDLLAEEQAAIEALQQEVEDSRVPKKGQ